MSAATETVFSRDEAKASDKKLYDLMLDQSRAMSGVDSALNSVHYAVKDGYRRSYDSRSGWKLSDPEAVDKAGKLAAEDGTYIGSDAAKALGRLVDAQAKLAEADKAVAVQNREWDLHGQWPRYSVVPGGHIHNELGCFTFHRGLSRTDVRWAYPVSGDTVEDAIEVYGAALCTHCFPEAPVDKTVEKVGMDAEGNPMTKAEVAAIKEARDAEKAAKLAAKNAAEVVDPITGKVLYKTERAAKNGISSAVNSAMAFSMDHPDLESWQRGAKVTIEALAAKGVDVETYVNQLAIRAGKRVAKELKGWENHWQVRQSIQLGIEVQTPVWVDKTWQELAELVKAWLA